MKKNSNIIGIEQEHTWRVVNHNSREIIESDSLGTIIRTVLDDIKYGEDIKSMDFYHIEAPNSKLNLHKYLCSHKRLVAQIKLASKSNNIIDIRYFIKRYKEQYS